MEEWRQANPDYWKQWGEKNKLRIKAKADVWRKKNADHIRKRERDRYHQTDGAAKAREKRAKNPRILIASRLRCRVNVALRQCRSGLRKFDTMVTLLGCSYSEFQKYIESIFTNGMTWEDVFSGQIHLDHKRPCSSFDLSNEDQQRECFHFSNYQPLWALDNLRKGAKIIALP